MPPQAANHPPKVLVCQHGARRRYAVARMLEEAGMLEALYTDSSAHSFFGRMSKKLGRGVPANIQRLGRREIRGVPEERIYSSDINVRRELIETLTGSSKQGLALFHRRHQLLSRQMKRWGVGDASVVYTMYHENLDFVKWAKTQGLRSVVDVFISPATSELMQREYAAFPDFGTGDSREEIDLEHGLWMQTAELADVLLCPSEWVAEGVRKSSPDAGHKIRVVPYGCSIHYGSGRNGPEPGRLFFAGGDVLRKGLHYLARAADQLYSILPNLEVRVAGGLDPGITALPMFEKINFLGKLTSDEMQREFLSADCFVLPSLSEGFAGVVAEALGAGCPVIVTREAGSMVEDGREGAVVPARNSSALSAAIHRMVADRDYRSACAAACEAQVPVYSEEHWGRRLALAIKESCCA